MKRERRTLTSPLELRVAPEGDSRHIEGYAMVFNTRSQDLGGFTEVISPRALEGVLERSDILALLNHDMSRGVLARFRDSGGSLKLEVDNKGLRYSFDAPNTALGDEVLEGVRRGDISGSSFAFTVRDEQWTEEEEGRYLRTILGFDQIFDVSPVYNPAYLDTSVEVDSRGLDAFKARNSEDEKEECGEDPEDEEENPDDRTDDPEDDEDPRSEDEKDEEDPDDRTDDPEDDEDDEDPRSEDEEEDEEHSDETDEEEDVEDEKENKEDKETNKRKNKFSQHRTMKKKPFSLLRAINAVVNRQDFDDVTNKMNEIGRSALRASSITPDGSIFLPISSRKEHRFEDNPSGIVASQNTEAQTYGGEAVPTQLFDLLGPLRDRLVVAQLGARMLSLNGNVEIPIYDGSNCYWESEIGKAKDGAGKFRTVKMTPKRITAYIPVSKQFLIQTDESAEALIRQDLVNCVAEKLQKTMFGDGAGDNITPAGLFNGVTEEASALTYGDVVNLESELEEANLYGEPSYVLSPSAKAVLRQTNIDKGSGRFVMENNEILGIKAFSTNSVVKKGLVLGDWTQFYIANFGALDLTVDPYTLAAEGQIRLIVNAWFDYLAVRPEAFVKRILK